MGCSSAASLACAGSAVLRRRSRVAAALFAAALAAPPRTRSGAGEALQRSPAASRSPAPCAMVLDAARAAAAAVVARLRDGRLRGRRAGRHDRRGAARDDRGDGRRRDARARPLAGQRWRWACALVGLAALGEVPVLAVVPFGRRRVAARAGAPSRRREFSPVVLAAILAYAATALTLLVVGQFVSLPPRRGRAGDGHGADRHGPRRADGRRPPARQRARRDHRRPDRARQPPASARPAGRRDRATTRARSRCC